MIRFWSSLIVLCLLAAPVRPSGPEIREQTEATVGVANRHGVVTPMFRRSSIAYTHAYSPFVAPHVEVDIAPPRVAALVSLHTQSERTDRAIILTRTSRGPPLG